MPCMQPHVNYRRQSTRTVSHHIPSSRHLRKDLVKVISGILLYWKEKSPYGNGKVGELNSERGQLYIQCDPCVDLLDLRW